MKLHDLRPAEGATKKRKRVGRGTGSGKGKTSTRGTKGQNSRTGGGVLPVFEGGQIKLVKRLPKLRGFNNRFKVHYTPINLDTLERNFDSGTTVDAEALSSVGLLGKLSDPVVVLGRGEITKPLHVKVQRISESARQKIEAAGGSVDISPYEVNRNLPRS
ncbi:MAG: 50S ribosomal protein L15 [Caldilineaceae bacterium]|nr:50S ribosomal protein L15 [Caldilineaceae bacterium]MCB0122760.1 50S ribosomal protein L15 [Caldilineaceae bacterium]